MSDACGTHPNIHVSDSKSHCKLVYPSYRYLSFLNQKDTNTIAKKMPERRYQNSTSRKMDRKKLILGIADMLKSEMKCYNDGRILSRKTLIFFIFLDELDFLVPGNL